MNTMLATFTEGSAGYVTIGFYDMADVPATPSSFQYRIDCETTADAIRGWTTIYPSSGAHVLTLTGTDTAIQAQSNETELRRLTVSADYGDGKINDEFFYSVKNLMYIPVV